MTNPLLRDWTTPFGIAPFDQISDDDFAPAFDAALAEHRGEIDAIAGRAEAATFANTIEALESAGRALDKVLSVFFTVAGADSTPAREALQREFSPRLAAHSAWVTSNKPLFSRVETLWSQRDTLNLSEEQNRVLMLTHRGFVRAGAALEGEADTRMAAIKSRLAVLGTEFTQNLLADEREWAMDLADEDLKGLPDFLINAARAAGAEQGKGPIITLSRSLATPFLQSSPRRDLREIVWRAFPARGAGTYDNRPLAAETLALRQERAQLLG